ncbi:MAG: TonB-dependent receptor [Methanococcaceae archaeon]
MKRVITFLLFFLCCTSLVLASTNGNIRGKVTDLQTGEPLIGANVVVVGTTFGATTDVKGEYQINNITAAIYTVKASYIGYKTVTTSNVRVNADLTTALNFRLPGEGINTGEVEIVAQRPLVQKDNTNANRITTSEDIDALPVRGINNILALTPGVTLQDKTIFIRGGRQDEVGYYLEGNNITDPVVGGRSINLVQDALEEIQVQAGGYTAEFGDANSGIIRQQFKSGTPDFKASLEYTTDNVGFNSKSNAYNGKHRLGAYWYGYNEATATVSGPLLEKIKFFGLFNYFYQRDQSPQGYPGINLGWVSDATTGDSINMTYPAGSIYKNSLQTYTGTATLTFDMNPLIFRLVGTYTQGTTYNPFSARYSGNIANILNLSRTEQLDRNEGAFNLKATHFINSKLFYELNGGYSFSKQNRFDPYLKDNFAGYGDSLANAAVGFTYASAYNPPVRKNIMGFTFYSPGEVVAAYQKYNRANLNFNGSLNYNFEKHSVKLGGEIQSYTIRNYQWNNESVLALASLIATNNALPAGDPQKRTLAQVMIGRGVNNYGYDPLGNEISSGPDAPHKPVFTSFYIQDKIEFSDLILNLGLRYDHYNIDNKMFIDPARPEKSINYNTGELISAGLVDVPTFSALSPRLGFSFPVTDRTVFHAQYGKFVQQSRLRDVYQGLYSTAYNLRGGLEITAPVGFNIRPTRTTQYEVGFTQQIGDFASFDITGFYKDIQDQVVFDKQSTDPTSPFKSYNILTNGDFATTKGVELSFNMRRTSRFQVNGAVTFQDAQGTGSFPNSARGIVGAPIDGVTIFKPQYISPLEFNNAIRGNLNIDYRFGKDEGGPLSEFGFSALMTFTSGHPYTLGIGGADLEGDARDRQPIEALNSSTTPWTFQVDLRVDKTFTLVEKLNLNIYLSVINLFDTKNILNVFLRTGTTKDDGYLSDPALGGKLIETNGQIYADLYRAINIDYYEQYQIAITGAPYTTVPQFYGPPRQIRLGVRFEY